MLPPIHTCTSGLVGEAALLVRHLGKPGVLDAISEQVRFTRRRFGHYEVIDFLAVLFGYAVSGERTLAAFYERLRPWANAFVALFGRDHLPSRSALSRWLARSCPIGGCPGPNDWRVTCVPRRLIRSRSACSVFPPPLLPRSGWRRRKRGLG